MTGYRRDVLQNVKVQADTHAGLWLDKYLESDVEGAKDQLVHEVAGISTSEVYRKFFGRWQQTLADCGAECREAEVLGRMAINLGAEAVLETSVALQHTYGVPYIPGSALKGLAAHYVMQYQDKEAWGKESEPFRTLFGGAEEAGYVTFFDALYVPDSGKNHQALWKDVITVHHPEYYQGTDAPPGDWDSPVPIPFITATGKFLIAMAGPVEWVEKAFEILELALEREGIGAKTSSGYGRMSFKSKEIETGSGAVVQRRAPREIPAGYEQGVVKMFDEGRGFGFIQPDHGGHDLFVHISDLEEGVNALHPRQKVTFKRGPGRKAGSEQAFDVRLDA
jgi:CRISPR-associated protein Cmr6